MAHNPIEELCDLMPGLEFQSDRAAHIPAEPPRPTNVPSRQQFFPLMKLPTEIRFMIYAIALQQTIDHAISPPFGTPRLLPAPACEQKWSRNPKRISHTFPRLKVTCPPLVGALGLLHTSRALRSESANEFNRLGFSHITALGAREHDLHNDHADLKSGTAQLSMARFSRIPPFKSVRERWVHLATELMEAHLDVRMARKMFWFICLMCHLKLGVQMPGPSTHELRRQVEKFKGVFRSSSSLPGAHRVTCHSIVATAAFSTSSRSKYVWVPLAHKDRLSIRERTMSRIR
jgi:hypothetical protein